MLLGDARVSTVERNRNGQRDPLAAAGAERVFADTISGTEVRRMRDEEMRPRPEIAALFKVSAKTIRRAT